LKDNYLIYIYTAGTKEYAEVIINLINYVFDFKYLSIERLVAREEVICEKGIFKSIKKVLPSHENMVLILDDRTDVWNNIENLINVKPFFFFINADKNKKNILEEKSLSDFDNDDYCLYPVTLLLKFIHHAFFFYYSKFRTICDIRFLKKQKMFLIFKDLIAAYIDKPYLNICESYEFNTIKKFGGNLETSISNSTNLLFIDYSSLKNNQIICKNNSYFVNNCDVVDKIWIYFCEFFFCKLKKDEFLYNYLYPQYYYSQKNIFISNKDNIDEFYSIDSIKLNNFIDDINCKYY
jgi:hypothetical protein